MLDKKLDEYVTRVENDAYELGVSVGKNQERERIIELLDGVKLEWWQTDWEFYRENAQNPERDEPIVYDLMHRLIALIKGES
jgi:hypothetical protein